MRNLLRLRPLFQTYWLQVLLAMIATLSLTAINLVVPFIIQQVIDVGLGQKQLRFLAFAGLAILAIGVLRSILLFTQRFLSEWIAAHISYDLRNRLYDHIQNLPFSFHDHTQTGQLISRCIEDVRALERFTGFGLVELIHMVLLTSGIVLLLFSLQPRLAIIAILPVMMIALLATSFGMRIGSLFLKLDISLGELSARLQENISGVQVVRAFAREPYEIKRFNQQNRVLYNARVNIIRSFSRVIPTTVFLLNHGTILILWFGGQMALRGEMTIGEVVAFNSYLLMLAMPARQLVWLVNAGGEAIAGLQRTFEVLDLVPEIRSPRMAIELPSIKGEVEFQQVCFRYTEQDSVVLDNINVRAQPNQIIALVGATGSGKTSLVNLIPRFYEVTSGVVLVDGIDIRRVELASLRRQIGVVLQTSLLFSVSITENIAYGKPKAHQKEIEVASRAAQAHGFIMQLPDGYQTIVGERGVTLSGGQRQRVAIARALLMDPRILILDDSTSSVDTETEQLIQQALDRVMQDRTTFVIAHRLSTVRRADLILVLEDGRIVERGTHLELLGSNGLYRDIYNLQLRDQDNFSNNHSKPL